MVFPTIKGGYRCPEFSKDNGESVFRISDLLSRPSFAQQTNSKRKTILQGPLYETSTSLDCYLS